MLCQPLDGHAYSNNLMVFFNCALSVHYFKKKGDVEPNILSWF